MMQAYQDYGYPNFSIVQGKRFCIGYDGNNIDEGVSTLLNYLNSILANNTASVYLLRVYPEGVSVDSGSNYKGSTTFMLSPTAMTTTVPGPGGVGTIQIMDRGGQYQAAQPKDLMSRVEKLEKENESLRERVHKAELDNIRTDFSNQIAGLKRDQDEKGQPSWVDRIFDFLEKKPDAMDKVGEMVSSIAGIFSGRKDYIVNRTAPAAVSGTTKTADNSNQDMEPQQVQLTQEGALINPFLQDSERSLKRGEQQKILADRLTPLTQDQHDDIQGECLEVIENRIGSATLSRMLLAVACMDNDDLNKLLNHLD